MTIRLSRTQIVSRIVPFALLPVSDDSKKNLPSNIHIEELFQVAADNAEDREIASFFCNKIQIFQLYNSFSARWRVIFCNRKTLIYPLPMLRHNDTILPPLPPPPCRPLNPPIMDPALLTLQMREAKMSKVSSELLCYLIPFSVVKMWRE